MSADNNSSNPTETAPPPTTPGGVGHSQAFSGIDERPDPLG